DSVALEQITALKGWQAKSSTSIRLLPPLNDGPELDSVETAATSLKASVIQLTPDNTDVSRIARGAKFVPAAASDKSEHWQEAGYWLCPWIALLSLAFFRRGWMAPTAAR